VRIDLVRPAPRILRGCHHQNRNADAARLERAREAPAIQYRHPHIQQHQRRVDSIERLKPIRTVRRSRHEIAFRHQNLGDGGPDSRIIIDNQNWSLRHGCSPSQE
jgi:hypothetical protein